MVKGLVVVLHMMIISTSVKEKVSKRSWYFVLYLLVIPFFSPDLWSTFPMKRMKNYLIFCLKRWIHYLKNRAIHHFFLNTCGTKLQLRLCLKLWNLQLNSLIVLICFTQFLALSIPEFVQKMSCLVWNLMSGNWLTTSIQCPFLLPWILKYPLWIWTRLQNTFPLNHL